MPIVLPAWGSVGAGIIGAEGKTYLPVFQEYAKEDKRESLSYESGIIESMIELTDGNILCSNYNRLCLVGSYSLIPFKYLHAVAFSSMATHDCFIYGCCTDSELKKLEYSNGEVSELLSLSISGQGKMTVNYRGVFTIQSGNAVNKFDHSLVHQVASATKNNSLVLATKGGRVYRAYQHYTEELDPDTLSSIRVSARRYPADTPRRLIEDGRGFLYQLSYRYLSAQSTYTIEKLDPNTLAVLASMQCDSGISNRLAISPKGDVLLGVRCSLLSYDRDSLAFKSEYVNIAGSNSDRALLIHSNGSVYMLGTSPNQIIKATNTYRLIGYELQE